MGISRSLDIGTSSLKSHQKRFDVMSNNIANVNTIGYKSSRVTFAEQFYQTMKYGSSPDNATRNGLGGVNPHQYGLGVKVGAITADHSQGTFEYTDRPLDLGIQGDGFFIYDYNGQQMFSRAGAISLDRDGNLTDSATGALLQGYNVSTDSNGRLLKDSTGINQLSSSMEGIVIEPGFISSPKQTENINLTGNLNSGSPEGAERQTSINVFDYQGAVKTLTFSFTKTANPNEYSISATIDGKDLTISDSLLQFNNDGTLNSPMNINITAADMNAALESESFDTSQPRDISVKLADSQHLMSGLTQFSGPNTATMSTQDGYTSGELIGLSSDEKGQLWGAFTNGKSELLGQVALAKFSNPAGLVKQGSNFFMPSPNSGSANFGTAVDIFPSTSIQSGSLEQSNVDLTDEFTEMIRTQRAFEAASRTITVTDQMLSEIMLLKR